jgi:hypothetical protein
MKIAPRTKFWLVMFGMIIGALFVSPQMIGLDRKYEDILFFGWLVVGSVLLIVIRCPTCGTPLAFQGRIGGLPLIAGFANKQCKKCGHDLTSTD